ncbi:Rv3654c family TadE-like protein [Tropheryma whipplei]|uniref:Rv3654c family TadE-like protein n=1 Tax=Tropheryma whipplei TaxID=2039 RepID=UPI0004AE073F|nr:Rv3654c family TadE-like protein [Tropheryma whipplei]
MDVLHVARVVKIPLLKREMFPSLKGEGGSGSILTISCATIVFIAGIAVLLLGQILFTYGKMSLAADQAALTAADIHRNIVEGVPCDAASEVSKQHGVAMISCRLSGETATVVTSTNILGIEIRATAKAGAPPS